MRAFARAGYSRVAVGASAARNEASRALEEWSPSPARRGSSSSSSSPSSSVSVFSVPLNRTEALDEALEKSRPDVVVFDRFTSEEAFSWRVREKCPGAARVLDMQDCHSLRRARARAVELADNRDENDENDGSNAVLAAMKVTEAADAAGATGATGGGGGVNDNRDALREFSSILRSDLTLVCSPFELEMLRRTLFLDANGETTAKDKLVLAPLFAPRRALPESLQRDFASRRHFVAIGSFLHPPNVDSLLWLAGKRQSAKNDNNNNNNNNKKKKKNDTIWDMIRSSRPEMRGAELHVFGSYAHKSAAAAEVHDPRRGVFVHGRTSNLAPLARARVLLAPLRFGAGLKGKIADAWLRGTPVVTTPVGAEGMSMSGDGDDDDDNSNDDDDGGGNNDGLWGGSRTSTTAEKFAEEACRLYLDESAWRRASREASRLHDALYFEPRPADAAVAAVDALFDLSPSSASSSASSSSSSSSSAEASPQTVLQRRRSRDFVGACLWADSARATEYFSRWIELKEKSKNV